MLAQACPTESLRLISFDSTLMWRDTSRYSSTTACPAPSLRQSLEFRSHSVYMVKNSGCVSPQRKLVGESRCSQLEEKGRLVRRINRENKNTSTKAIMPRGTVSPSNGIHLLLSSFQAQSRSFLPAHTTRTNLLIVREGTPRTVTRR